MFKMNLLLLFILILCKCTTVFTSDCENFQLCGDCIRYALDQCVWCSAEKHQGSRCASKNNINTQRNTTWCATEVYESKKEIVFQKDVDFSSEALIQFKPQQVKIKVSPGVPVNIEMSYKPAVDAPLDVYCLIDNSYSMNKYIQKLKEQAENIYKTLTSFTNNVRLGIGFFVEKPALPFVNIHISPTYCFKNALPLTNDTEKFQEVLDNKTSSGNYDDQEAVLDGLMQAMVCKDEVGWRKEAHRIIVVFTDGSYHSAGDGKAVGAFKPHDMKCHIDGTMDTVLDYPSLSQINKIAKDNSYSIIFAVTDTFKTDFELLSQYINGGKYILLTEQLDVATMIKEEYLKIVRNFDLRHNTSTHIQIKKPDCISKCQVLHNQPLNINVTFKVVSCPKLPHRKETITIGPAALQESLTVEIEFDCECDCEKDFSKMNSSKCNNAGTYQCGLCKCNPNRYGSDCRCEGDSTNNLENFDSCKKNINETLFCSGRGECRCGKCEQCSVGFSGQFCEFDDNACLRPGGVLCSGNGDCTLGRCACKPTWSGEGCDCPTDDQSCIAPHSSELCSGNGACVCGKCVCNRMENADDQCRGRFCDDCEGIAVKRCDELKDYAYCVFLNLTICRESYNQSDTEEIFVNKTEFNSPESKWYMANWCRIEKDDSTFVFKYYYPPETDNNGTKLVLILQNELEKPEPVNIWVAVGSTLGAIFLIGLLTLILWKVVTSIYDEREYKQFEEKARAAGYILTENPWYEPPVTQFRNPAYKDN